MLASRAAATDAITVRLDTQSDVVILRHRVREHALELGFSLLDQTKIVTAASELGRNAITYGGGGEAVIESLHDGRRVGMALTVTDHGPGIADVEQAMRPGFSTGSGLGYGLSGTKRLVDEFEIRSHVGVGTTIRIARWR